MSLKVWAMGRLKQLSVKMQMVANGKRRSSVNPLASPAATAAIRYQLVIQAEVVTSSL